MFGKLFGGKAKDAVNKFSGNKDFLEGLAAACALVAAADGSIDDTEFDMTLRVIQGNAAIAAGFGAGEIEQSFSKMSKKTGTRSGKSELKQEIRQVLERDKSGTMGMAICLAALDVADAGGISDQETAILKDLCVLCGQNYDKLQGGRTARGETSRYLAEVVLPYEGDDCLIWPFAKTKGYAVMNDGERGYVSRIVCTETYGEPSDPELQALHNCSRGQDGCVAKKHLRWGTRSDNERDKIANGTYLTGGRKH